jgi:F0F1-type ATP synthase membrane subunit c/vacuolar-type H+-ATPase subunit K
MASIYFGLLGLGMALMLPLAAIGCGIGEGLIFASALQGIAIVEALFIFNLVFFFIVKSMLPDAATLTTLLAK